MIEFFSSIKGVSEFYPIVPTKKAMPDWVKAARQEMVDGLNIIKCPGIFELFGSGYVVPCPWDIEVISTEEKLQAFMNPVMEDLLRKPPLQVQMSDSIGKHLPKRPWSNKNILKLNTPWHVKSKYKIIMLPLEYSDLYDFESAIGILDPSISSEINIQGYVNFFGKRTIKAGYPLCQLIPMTEKKLDLIVRDANSKDLDWIKKKMYFDNSLFNFNRNLIKNAYNTFMKGE